MKAHFPNPVLIFFSDLLVHQRKIKSILKKKFIEIFKFFSESSEDQPKTHDAGEL